MGRATSHTQIALLKRPRFRCTEMSNFRHVSRFSDVSCVGQIKNMEMASMAGFDQEGGEKRSCDPASGGEDRLFS
jgi:hypothetical protein